jgi:hypothetical protein
MQESYPVPKIILEEAEEATLQLLPAKKYFLNLMIGKKNGG